MRISSFKDSLLLSLRDVPSPISVVILCYCMLIRAFARCHHRVAEAYFEP